jgi:hypothetical protein
MASFVGCDVQEWERVPVEFWKGVLEHLGEGGRETRLDVRLAAEGEEGAEAEREDGANYSSGHDGSSETS